MRVIVFLLLGVAMTVAVTWSSAALSSRASYHLGLTRQVYRQYREDASRAFALSHDAEVPIPEGAFSTAFRDIITTNHRSPGPRAIAVTTQTHRCGFPFRAMDGQLIETADYGDRSAFSEGRHVRVVPIIMGMAIENGFDLNCRIDLCQGRDQFVLDTTQRLLPLRVIFPGFVFNSAFYAAILWLLFFVPGSVRRTIRRRRGLCPACAYPVGTSPVCTECGKPVTNRKAETQKAENI